MSTPHPAPLSAPHPAPLRADVAVVGLGPVGAALAIALAQAGVSVVGLDRADPRVFEDPGFDGRAYAVALTSQKLLAAIGVWRHLPAPPQAMVEIRTTDGDLARGPSPLFLHFDAAEVGGTPFGWMVEARHLRLALNARMAELAAEGALRLVAPAAITRVERTAAAATVERAGGPPIRAALIAACDGRDSPLRKQAGIAETGWDYGVDAIVGALAHELPHRGTAQERFLPGGVFALLPLAGNHSAYVWCERRSVAATLMGLSDTAYARELARRAGDHLGAITPLPGRWRYPLGATHVHRYTDTRLALVGDAAHRLHPLAGQALNLGWRDVASLAEAVVGRVRLGLDCADAETLAAYQRARRAENLAMIAFTDAMHRLFSNASPPLRLVRRLGLAAFNAVGPLRRGAMRAAMGERARLPALLAGRPL
ncbi:MAG: FAD-dependent monooxygenase [Alphaproteobacteria bacterium]|nr:FAD-dependent monooxygenase [Alphaproteobacteria bacterium]